MGAEFNFEDDDPKQPAAATWSDWLDEIDDLVATASTTGDPQKRQLLLEQALQRACRFLTRVNRRLERFIDETLKESGIGGDGLALRLGDLAAANPELEVFRNREALEDFLNSVSDLLEKQGYLNRKRLTEIKGEVSDRFDQMQTEPMGFEELMEKFRMLRRLICRPPEGPDGGTGPGGPPGGGTPESRGQRASRIIQTLGALATIGALIGALLFGASSEKRTRPAPTPPSPGQLPHEIRLLALLLLAALASWLDSQGMIPDAEPEIEDSPTDEAVQDRVMTAGV